MLRNRTIHYRPDRARQLAATAIAPGQIPLMHELPLQSERRRKQPDRHSRAFRKRTSFSCASTSVARLPDAEPPCPSADHPRGCISATRSFETPLHASAEKCFSRPRSVSHVPCRARANATIHVAALTTRPALVQQPQRCMTIESRPSPLRPILAPQRIGRSEPACQQHETRVQVHAILSRLQTLLVFLISFCFGCFEFDQLPLQGK